MRRSHHQLLSLALMSLFAVACGHKSTPAVQATAPAVDEDKPAVVVVAPTPAPAAGGLDGDWQGDSGEKMPVSFHVENNQVTSANVSFSAKKGSCNAFATIGSDGPTPIAGKSFKTHGLHDKFEFTMTGTFTSATEASGTIDWKTNSDICGEVDAQLKWTAKKGATPPPEDTD